jgi:hypothetical protein
VRAPERKRVATRTRAGPPLVATYGADDAGGLNAVIPVGPDALLFVCRGCADLASPSRRGPRFHAPRGVLVETLTSLPIANLETDRVVGSPATVVAQRRVALWRELGCDAVAVDAAADALADRLTRTEQAPALPLS